MTRNASPLAAALALFVLSIVSGCAGLEIDGDVAQAEISHVLGPSSALDTGVEPTQARVYEDGLYYPFKVVVRRHQGQTVRIAAWTNDNRFLGEKSVVPPYESTEWKRLSLFMPYSGIHLGSESIDGNVYVLEPGDSRKYLATVGMGVTSIARQRFISHAKDGASRHDGNTPGMRQFFQNHHPGARIMSGYRRPDPGITGPDHYNIINQLTFHIATPSYLLSYPLLPVQGNSSEHLK